ncbi:MAG: hypothetical protein ACU0BF_02360 [Paracoccaceae bacterium]
MGALRKADAEITALRDARDELAVQLEEVRSRDARRKQTIERLRPKVVANLLAAQVETTEFALAQFAPGFPNAIGPSSAVLARGLEALPAAAAVARATGARLVCDVLEVRAYDQRVGNPDATTGARLIAEAAQANLLQTCDHVLTVSPTIARDLLDALAIKASVMGQWHISNRHNDDATITGILRDAGRIIVVNCLQNQMGPLVPALNGVAEILARDPSVICVIAGRIAPVSFAREVSEHIAAMACADRILIFDQLEPDAYGTVLARADVGLVTLDPKIGNHLASFPNRVVDFAAFGVPICTPALPDVTGEPRLDGRLHIVNDVRDPTCWRSAIDEALTVPRRAPVLAGRDWAAEFIDGVAGTEVAVIDNSWRWHGNRIKRQVSALLSAGRPVTYLGRNYVVVDGVRRSDPDHPFLVERFEKPSDLTQVPAWS